MSSLGRSAALIAVAISARVRGMLLFPLLALRNRSCREAVIDPNAGTAVCLTTYGVRLAHVHLVVESIARGRARPAMLILWLSPGDAARPLPRGLMRLQRRGLSVRVCEELRSHKKYYPFMAGREADDLILVTADDDVYYPRDWLSDLTRSWQSDPSAVWCFRSRTMLLDDGRIAPYRAWPLSKGKGPSFRLVPTGVSGVLYPPAVVEEVRSRGMQFLDLAPTADDLWLHSLAVSRGVHVRRVAHRARHFAVAPSAKGSNLMSDNLNGENDRVITRLYRTELTRRILEDGPEGRGRSR